MSISVAGLRAKVQTPSGRKAFRYAMVSVISLVVSQITLFALFTGFHWTARSANVAASVAGGVPSYSLNRRWTWGKRGRSNVWREMAPFWIVAFASLVLSTFVADFAETRAIEITSSRLAQGLIINCAVIGTYGIIWAAKFLLLNALFVTAVDEAPA
ncbi:MAG: GtrA family protein [Acidimicrobiales bacterium]